MILNQSFPLSPHFPDDTDQPHQIWPLPRDRDAVSHGFDGQFSFTISPVLSSPRKQKAGREGGGESGMERKDKARCSQGTNLLAQLSCPGSSCLPLAWALSSHALHMSQEVGGLYGSQTLNVGGL